MTRTATCLPWWSRARPRAAETAQHCWFLHGKPVGAFCQSLEPPRRRIPQPVFPPLWNAWKTPNGIMRRDLFCPAKTQKTGLLCAHAAGFALLVSESLYESASEGLGNAHARGKTRPSPLRRPHLSHGAKPSPHQAKTRFSTVSTPPTTTTVEYRYYYYPLRYGGERIEAAMFRAGIDHRTCKRDQGPERTARHPDT